MATHHLVIDGHDVTLDGRPVEVPAGANPHAVAVRAAKEVAADEAEPGQSVHVEIRSSQGVVPLTITDGVVSAGTSRGAVPLTDDPMPHPASEDERPAPSHVAEPLSSPAPAVAATPAADPAPLEASPTADQHGATSLRSLWASAPRPAVPRERHDTTPSAEPSPVEQPNPVPTDAPSAFQHTFIEKHRTEQASAPQPVGGFAGVLAQFGIGGPSQAQQKEEADKIAVSRVWTLPKGIAVANGKGGSGKTPTSLYLAAMFARFGGGMVLVDDNNTFRGAAGWQTENAAHGATKEDLLAALPHFDGSERAADMARFTHHQTIDRYDVLQSRPQKLARDQALDDDQFDAIQELLRRFYRVVVFDSGNDESAPNWLRMIHHSDALVVPTATTPKHCESAKLLLEALTAQGGHSADLARNAVIVVSHASTNDPAPEEVAPKFHGMAREVLTIPHDPAMAREWLRWDDLAARTQRAWLAVGAAIARGMED